MKEEFKKGDRVQSIAMGFYCGQKGTLIRPAQAQYGKWTRFEVELDIGITITLPAHWIEDVEDE
ncbi:MAG: hypothetical protein GX913_01110 [Clostridiales bacterium]|nr:hypothetical protein [Clostridiales bacterium]